MVRIPCHHDNHHQMPFEYVCLNSKCIQISNTIGCINCLQQSHNNHLAQTQSMKVFLYELTELASLNKTQYHILDLLLKGIAKCKNYQQLKQNFGQLIAYKCNNVRFEKIVDKEIETCRSKVAKFYSRQVNQSKKNSQQIVQASKKIDQINFITPILNFQQGNFQLLSPFCVKNKKQGFCTCIAYPTLNKYAQSIKIDIKVTRMTPHWMGIGISLGQQDYNDESKNHMLALANGWIVQQGQKSKQGIKFSTNDIVTLKWDKQKQVLQFSTHNEQNKCWMKLQNKWDRQVYLCVVFYHKGDIAEILV